MDSGCVGPRARGWDERRGALGVTLTSGWDAAPRTKPEQRSVWLGPTGGLALPLWPAAGLTPGLAEVGLYLGALLDGQLNLNQADFSIELDDKSSDGERRDEAVSSDDQSGGESVAG